MTDGEEARVGWRIRDFARSSVTLTKFSSSRASAELLLVAVDGMSGMVQPVDDVPRSYLNFDIPVFSSWFIDTSKTGIPEPNFPGPVFPTFRFQRILQNALSSGS